MKTIELRHNPFKAETVLTIDGREAHLNCLGTGEGSHLEDWKDEFFPQIIKKTNIGPGSACAVIFYGVREDFDTLQPEHTAFCADNDDIKLYFEYGTKPPVTVAGTQQALHELIGKAVSESPCDELKTPEAAAKIAEIQNAEYSAYISQPEKLCRQAAEYVKFVDGLKLREGAEGRLATKKAEIEKLRADIEGSRRLEAEKAGTGLEALAEKLDADGRKAVEETCQANLAEIKGAIHNIRENLDKDYKGNKDSLENLLKENQLQQINRYWAALKNTLAGFESFGETFNGPIVSTDIPDVELNIEKSLQKNPEGETSFLKSSAALAAVTLVPMPIIGIAARILLLTGALNQNKKTLNMHQGENKESSDSLYAAAIEYAEKTSAELKERVVAELEKVLSTLREKIAAEKAHSQQALEKEIAAIETQLAWAEDFTTKLNMALEIGGTR
jgi:hypothetical protein